MRKTTLFVLIIALLLVLTGCQQTDNNVSGSDTTAPPIIFATETQEVVTSTEQTSSAEETKETGSNTTYEETETASDSTTSKPVITVITSSQFNIETSGRNKPDENTGTKETFKSTVSSTLTPMKTTATVAEDIVTTRVPTCEHNTQSRKTTTSSQVFDIDYWIDYAKSYAQSKGLVLDAAAVDCWDNPIRAGSHCIYLDRDIQSRLNRYANDEDITDVWIWVESVSNDCYDIYIGYA